MDQRDPLVTAEWLKENIDAPDIRVVDATWFMPSDDAVKTAHQAYMDGHIPGPSFSTLMRLQIKTALWRICCLTLSSFHRVCVRWASAMATELSPTTKTISSPQPVHGGCCA